MGCDGKPFLPKFVSFFSKLQLALITMVTCQGAPVNANQLRMGKWFLFLLAYKNISADFFLPKSYFPIDCYFRSSWWTLGTPLDGTNTKCSRDSLANKPEILTYSLSSNTTIDSKHINHPSSFIQRTAQVARGYCVLVIKQCSLNPKNMTNSLFPSNIHNSILRNDKTLKANLGICSQHIRKHNATGVYLNYSFNGLYLAQLSVKRLLISYAPKYLSCVHLKFRNSVFQVSLCLPLTVIEEP